MKVCVAMWSVQRAFYQNKIDAIGFIEQAERWGVDGIELMDFFFKNEAEIEEVIKTLDKKKLPVAALAIENDFAVRYPEELDGQVAYAKEAIDTAIRLKSPLLRILSGYAKHDLPYETGLEFIIKGLQTCVDYAQKKGITLVVENQGLYTGTSDKIKNLVSKIGSDYLKINMDTGNFPLELEDPIVAAEKLKDQIAFVHFKDIKRMAGPDGDVILAADNSTFYRLVTGGEGDVDLPGIVNILKDANYTGYLSVEYEGDGDCILETENSIKYLRSLL